MKRGSFNPGRSKLQVTSLGASVYVFFSLMIISILLLLFSGGNILLPLKDSGLSLFLGVRGGIYELSSFVSRTINSVKELSDLRKQHADLLKQLERYEELERSNAEIYQENARLREQLNFAKNQRYKLIPAQISGRDPDNLFSALVINKGTFSGVKNDMIVVALQNGTQALVGKVIRCGTLESLIMPIFDVNSMLSSRFSETRFEGITEGQGILENFLLMRFVPKRAREEINIGDMIVTSGLGGIFPAGINIGRVGRINSQDYETTLDIEIIPVIDFSRLEYVFIIEAETQENTID
jgi:rod shape-determining protein MreC